jgi:hypothetical protein
MIFVIIEENVVVYWPHLQTFCGQASQQVNVMGGHAAKGCSPHKVGEALRTSLRWT